MRGQLDWAGLEILSEMIGVDDMEILIDELFMIRDYAEEKSSVKNRGH